MKKKIITFGSFTHVYCYDFVMHYDYESAQDVLL